MSRVQFIVTVPTSVQERKENHELSQPPDESSKSCDEKNERRKQTMEEVLHLLIQDLNILCPIWTLDSGCKYRQVSFFVHTGKESEETIKALVENGIGAKKNSSVSAIPCSVLFNRKENSASVNGGTPLPNASQPEGINASSDNTAWETFVQSIQPRIRVAQILESVQEKATLTFDYVSLLVIAGFTASLGLVENNAVIQVASMLISPMMGPVIAAMFGTGISNRRLQKIGFLNGLFSVFLCVFIGFISGAFIEFLQIHPSDGQWPTAEMVGKGELRSLWVGTIIAILSGGAIALAILGDNTESVIGVAISAALLPPTVNAGLFWGLAVINWIYIHHVSLEEYYNPVWSKDPSLEFAALGGVSLCLSLINIIFIYVAGILILKVKDVTPKKNSYLNSLQMAREYRPFTDEEANTLTARLGDELIREEAEVNTLRRRFSQMNILKDGKYSYQKTWSPAGSTVRPSVQDMAEIIKHQNARRPRSSSFAPSTSRKIQTTPRSPQPSTSRSPQPSTSRSPQPSTSRSPQPSTSRSPPLAGIHYEYDEGLTSISEERPLRRFTVIPAPPNNHI